MLGSQMMLALILSPVSGSTSYADQDINFLGIQFPQL